MAKKAKKAKTKKKVSKQKKFNTQSYAKLWDYKLHSAEDSRNLLMNLNSELIKENEALKQKINSSNEDMLEVVGYFKDQDIQKTTRIKEIEEQAAEMTVSFQQKVDTIKQKAEEEVEQIRGNAEDTEKEFEQVRAELNSLNEFYNMREKIAQEMERIKDSAEMTLQEHRKEIENMKKDHQKELSKIKEYMLREIERIKMHALEEALRSLQEAEQVVYEENLRLSDLAVQNSSTIAKLRNRLENRGQNILMLTNEKEALNKDMRMLTAGKMKDMEVRDKLVSRVTELEEITKAIKSEHSIVNQQLNRHWNDQCKDHVEEGTKLKLVLNELLKENKKLKKLSKELLENRTDIERFFLESLDYVKNQIRPNIDTVCGKSKEARLPPIRAGKGSELYWVEKLSRPACRMEDLSWEQREGILRFIFARINMAEKDTAKYC